MPKSSFAPIENSEISILILGSIPGDRSIAMQEYYGHPQNRFWKMLAHITGKPEPASYAEKKALLLQSGIGLWDVARTADREGSMDSAIRNETPNDIDMFLDCHPHISTIVFNGRKAENMFRKFFSGRPCITYCIMPSTSPANAAYSLDELCRIWSGIFPKTETTLHKLPARQGHTKTKCNELIAKDRQKK